MAPKKSIQKDLKGEELLAKLEEEEAEIREAIGDNAQAIKLYRKFLEDKNRIFDEEDKKFYMNELEKAGILAEDLNNKRKSILKDKQDVTVKALQALSAVKNNRIQTAILVVTLIVGFFGGTFVSRLFPAPCSLEKKQSAFIHLPGGKEVIKPSPTALPLLG